MPGVGIGNFTLGMSKDEVLKKLGRPEVIVFAGNSYTLDNLPRRYRMSFGDISLAMVDDAVIGISAHSPSYKLANGLRVGDSEEKRIEAFGDDELEYDDKGILVRVDEKNGTVREITVYPAEGDDDNEDEDQDDPGEGFDPDVLLEAGKNPGLGVRALHAQGITGAGVHVGLIDMGGELGHPEYAGKIVSYNHAGMDPGGGSMHGPYVTSLLVGKQCGTAPGAKLHVEAVDLAEHDAGLCARALDRFVTYNESASKDQKIRVVSVSAAPSGEGSDYKNQSLWDESVQRAEAQGILVLDLTWHHGIISICWQDVKDRENVEACTPGFLFGPVEVDEGHIHVPRTFRTSARAPSRGPFSYSYSDGGRRSNRPYSKSGYSPTVPYAAGVLAMGWQIRPDLTAAQMKESLFESAHVHESGAKIINPTAFIELVRKQR